MTSQTRQHYQSVSIFDIETAPDMEAVRRITPFFDPATVKTGHMTKPASIAAKREQAEREYWRGVTEKAALNPATARIVAIGIHHPGAPPVILDGTEEEVLRAFWQEFALAPVWAYWSGNNAGGAFDPRFLIVRSWVNRVVIPAEAFAKGSPGKLSAAAWIDLAPRYLIGAETNSTCSANSAARTLGLVGQDPGWAEIQDKESLRERGVHGANFHECWADPLRHELARQYLLNDLAIERAIADLLLGKEVAA